MSCVPVVGVLLQVGKLSAKFTTPPRKVPFPLKSKLAGIAPMPNKPGLSNVFNAPYIVVDFRRLLERDIYIVYKDIYIKKFATSDP
jgi:hypothetical protein